MTLTVKSGAACKCGSFDVIIAKDGSRKCAGCKSLITQTLAVTTKKEATTMASKKDVAKAAPKAAEAKKTITIEKDEHGFKVGSKSSIIYTMLLTGKHTKAEIEKAVDSVGKSTVSVFLGDLQKPVGTYPVSKGVKVSEDEKTHKLSIETAKATKTPAAKKGGKAAAAATA